MKFLVEIIDLKYSFGTQMYWPLVIGWGAPAFIFSCMRSDTLRRKGHCFEASCSKTISERYFSNISLEKHIFQQSEFGFLSKCFLVEPKIYHFQKIASTLLSRASTIMFCCIRSSARLTVFEASCGGDHIRVGPNTMAKLENCIRFLSLNEATFTRWRSKHWKKTFVITFSVVNWRNYPIARILLLWINRRGRKISDVLLG